MRKDKEAGKEYARKYYLKNKEKIKKRNDQWYANNKDKPELKEKRNIYRIRYEDINRKKLQIKAIKYYRKLKNEVFSKYGKICVVCGIQDIEFLEIDHMSGNGRAHLRSLYEDGLRFYPWLKKNNFPSGFQTLCSNCNWKKRLSSIEYKDTRSSVSSVKIRLRNKHQLFNILGMKCACCSLDDFDLLTVEHKNNDGANERRNTSSYTMLKLIRTGNVDLSRYETLCRNCNVAKGRNGYCPHFTTLKELIAENNINEQ